MTTPKKPPTQTKAGKVVTALRKRKTLQGVSLYTPEMVDLLYNMVSDGLPLKLVCRQDNMPSLNTVQRWKREHPEFKSLMREASMLQEESLLDEVELVARGDPESTTGNLDRDKLLVAALFKRLNKLEERREKNDKPLDPKLIETTSENGTWRVLENGERANPVSDAIDDFMRKSGMVKSAQKT